MYRGVYRKGDVVRFARGSNEYVGKVETIHGVLHGLAVAVEGEASPWTVKMKHVLQVVEPVLTEKERAVLVVLLWPRRPSRSVADLKAQGYSFSGTTFAGLAQRGLVVGERLGVTASGPMQWKLSAEGRRVATGL